MENEKYITNAKEELELIKEQTELLKNINKFIKILDNKEE